MVYEGRVNNQLLVRKRQTGAYLNQESIFFPDITTFLTVNLGAKMFKKGQVVVAHVMRNALMGRLPMRK